MYSPLEQFEVVSLINLSLFNLDFSLFNFIISYIYIYISIYILYIYSIYYKFIPINFQYIYEYIYIFVEGIVFSQLNKKGIIYLPFLFVLFNFILFNNIIGLLPFGIALTSQIIVILFMSFLIMLSIFMTGIIKYGINFFKIFIPTSPFLLLLILIPIEIFSYIIRLFSLAIRLAANIIAGHTLVYIISNFIMILSYIKYWLYIIMLIPLFAILFLEFGISFLQAYVFIILVCIYLSDALSFEELKH